MAEKQQREDCHGDAFDSNKKAWHGNKEEVTFVWLTRTELHIQDSEGEFILKRLREINNYVVTFNDPSTCIKYIKLVKDERILLIVDGKLIIDSFDILSSCHAVDSIYIFCMHYDKYKHFLNRPKIAGIITHQSCLFNALQNGIVAIEQQVLAFSRLDQPHHVLTKDLSRESASFLWFMLLVEVLKAVPIATNDERTKMLDMCSAYYRDNTSFLAHIDEFRRTYTCNQALSWYTRPTFIYKLVNKALRVEDVELLYQFCFFIIDLCKQLEDEWFKAQSFGLIEICSVVYRGGRIALDEFVLLIPDHIITTNGFFSTTRSENVAHMFAGNPITDESNYRAVIFHITIPENLTSLVFADVDHKHTKFTYENEVIFSIGSRFRVDRMYVDDDKPHLYHIGLTATDDGCEDVNAYRIFIQHDLNERKAIFLFGCLLLDMNQRKKARSYFQLLLETTPKDDQFAVATIHNYLGHIERENGYLNKALSHHTIALQLREQLLPSNHTDLSASVNSLGLDYFCLGELDQAFDYFNRALTIETIIHAGEDGHSNISKILGHLAFIHRTRGDDHLALHYFMRALKIEGG